MPIYRVVYQQEYEIQIPADSAESAKEIILNTNDFNPGRSYEDKRTIVQISVMPDLTLSLPGVDVPSEYAFDISEIIRLQGLLDNSTWVVTGFYEDGWGRTICSFLTQDQEEFKISVNGFQDRINYLKLLLQNRMRLMRRRR